MASCPGSLKGHFACSQRILRTGLGKWVEGQYGQKLDGHSSAIAKGDTEQGRRWALTILRCLAVFPHREGLDVEAPAGKVWC